MKKCKKKGKAAAAKGTTGLAAGGGNAPAPEEPLDIITLDKPGPEAKAQAPSFTAGANLVPEPPAQPLPASHLNAFTSRGSQAGSTRLNPFMPPRRSGTGHPRGDAQNRGRVPEEAAAAPIEPEWGSFGPRRDMDSLSAGSSNDGASQDEQQADTDDDSSAAKSIAAMIDEEREAAAEAAALFSGAGEWQSVLPKKGHKGTQSRGLQVTASVSQHNRQYTLPAHALCGRATAAAAPQQQSRFGSAPAFPPLLAQSPRGIPPQRISQSLRREAAAGHTSSIPLVGPPAPLHPHERLPFPSPIAASQPVAAPQPVQQQQQQQQPSPAFKGRLPSESNLSMDSLPIGFHMPPCLLYADLAPDIGKRVRLVSYLHRHIRESANACYTRRPCFCCLHT